MLTASRGYVGTAPGTTTLMVNNGHPALGAVCPPDLLPINVAPNQNIIGPAAAPKQVLTTWDPYGSEVELRGIGESSPLSLLLALAGGLAVGIYIAKR